jgi:hypothetical protein
MDRRIDERLSVRISPTLRDSLQDWAHDEEETVSVLVRRILRIGVARRDVYPSPATNPQTLHIGGVMVPHDLGQAVGIAQAASPDRRTVQAATDAGEEREDDNVFP